MRVCRMALLASVVVSGLGLPSSAQLRADQPPVLEPAPPLETPTPNDPAPGFLSSYQRAGAPRMMLLWNAELSPRTSSEWVLRENVGSSGSRSSNALRQESSSSAGSSTLDERGGQFKRETSRETSLVERQDPRRQANLSNRNAAQLQRAFEARMRQGGAEIVDYALALRLTALETATDVSSRRIEADAVRSRARLLLQILLVADDRAPLGQGFDVTVRSVESGVVLASFYSQAIPYVPPPRTVYLAGAKGFEKRTVEQGRAGVADVGAALADELMEQLGPMLLPSTAPTAR